MHNAVTVKNTFLNVDDTDAASQYTLGLIRAKSHPGFDMYASDARNGVDVGISTDDEDDGTVGSQFGQELTSSSSNSSAPRTPRAEERVSQVESDESLISLQREVERLAYENQRLEESNNVLQEACRAKSAAIDGMGASGQEMFGSQPFYDAATMCGMQGYMCYAVAMVPQPILMEQQMQATSPAQPVLQDRRKKQQQNAKLNGAKVETSGASAKKAAIPDSERTTVMLRNLPNNYTSDMLLEMIDSEGFAGKYDFVYLPIDFTTCACLGYAFVNLLDASEAARFWATFDGFSQWAIPSKKRCYVSWSDPHQGLQSNIDRYKNSPVMHESVPEEYKPRLFVDGVPVPFSPSTRKVRVPRLRR
eukprot:TRINITY_DN461_c2_g1_i1.p1 TRINITY_DN461_c2_g1~~TRINITY_DN461_c2_g1_i1.p1  ORF type:complete len:362 (+),score=81.31 TRINITY_DN461_c2_g1_i1:73-1158(+)